MKPLKLIFILPVFLFFAAPAARAQKPTDTWKLLADVKIKTKKDPKNRSRNVLPGFWAEGALQKRKNCPD